jgi:hypothetical protein
MGEGSGIDPIVNHNGVEVLECLCGDGIWQIKRCPPKLNNYWSALQKYTNHYYKDIIISKQTNYGILTLCYVGYWFATQGVLIELHKFWFCHDDLMHYVGRTNRKYALNRPTLPSLWLGQEGTYFIQIEVVALEEASFLLLEMSPH